MNLASKIRSVVTNSGMSSAYARWLAVKTFTGHVPRLVLPGGVHIGEWISFSEYWSFQDLVPAPERLLVERCLAKKTGTAFDVGANLGTFSCLIASLGPHVVHAFEPIPETFCPCKNNLRFNGLLERCRLNCLAVGRGSDLVTFHIQEDSPATNRMAIDGEKAGGEQTSTQVIAAIDLDGYCQSQKIEFVDFLKIDVEGMEPYVLQGASALLKTRKVAAILIEVCPGNLRGIGFSPADLYREFEAARYSPYALNSDGSPGGKLSLAQIEAMPLANVVLLPDV
jgi:FkbM family methyltransferase